MSDKLIRDNDVFFFYTPPSFHFFLFIGRNRSECLVIKKLNQYASVRFTTREDQKAKFDELSRNAVMARMDFNAFFANVIRFR